MLSVGIVDRLNVWVAGVRQTLNERGWHGTIASLVDDLIDEGQVREFGDVFRFDPVALNRALMVSRARKRAEKEGTDVALELAHNLEGSREGPFGS